MEKRSIKINYIYNVLYQMIGVIAPLITTPYISRVLGVENIGIYGFTSANVSYFLLLGSFGIATYAQLEVAKNRDNKAKIRNLCREIISARVIMMGISITIYFVFFFFFNKQYQVYYLILLIVLVADFLDLSWLCAGLEDYKLIAGRNILVRVISVICIFIFVKKESDLIAYFVINTVPTLLINVLIFFHIKENIAKEYSFNLHRQINHIKNAVVFFLPAVASTILSTTDKMMIGYLSSDSMQNGYYEQAIKIPNILFMFFATISTTMRSRLANMYEKGEEDNIIKYEVKTLTLSIFGGLPLCIGLMLISDVFVPVFFGEGYDVVIPLLKIMSFWILIKIISFCFLEQSLVAHGKIKVATYVMWTGVVANVILNFFFVKSMFAIGAAIASLITEFIVLLLTCKYVNLRTIIKEIKHDVIKSAIAVIVMGVVVIMMKSYNAVSVKSLLLMIIAGGISYTAISFIIQNSNLTYLFKAINDKLGKIFQLKGAEKNDV